MILTDMTKRELAEAVADMLAYLHRYGLDYAVGLDADGNIDTCYEGGRRLAVVIVSQAMDTDSYGGGEMDDDDIAAVADALEREWLDEHNAQHDEDEQIEWLEDGAL